MSAHARSAELEGEIRGTRAEMDETIEALKDRISPGELLDRALGLARQEGAEFGENIARRVKADPLPLALVVTGVAWLMMSDARHRTGAGHSGNGAFAGSGSANAFAPTMPRHDAGGVSPHETIGPTPASGDTGFARGYHGAYYREEPLDPDDLEAVEHHDRVHRTLSGVRQETGEMADRFSERLAEAKAGALGLKKSAEEEVHAFRERVDHAFESLSERASRARHRIAAQGARLWHGTRDGARHAAHAGADRARALGHQASQYYDDHPLVVGAVGVALGALLGSLLPRTRTEDRWLGETGSELREAARGAARDAATTAGDVAGRMGEAASEAARREGLTPEDAARAANSVVEKARRVGEEAIDAGRAEAEAHRHGNGAGSVSPPGSTVP
ncbi:MAG: DUF3618 domain-containing protein [Alphaproteobacteria bacterium]|nr:DUF3618 domain-containing protein [Alphaproteobacteria bacterium]